LPRQEAESGSLVDPGSPSSPPSPSGWSDLPSDAEDTFFFSASETSEFRRSKRRRLLDAAQSARLRSLRERDADEDADPEEGEEEAWGGDDEEPDEAQAELMRRTVRHVISSPDPVLLEMRILANHGSDRRFAFLRGRWKHNWRRMKALAKAEIQAESSTANKPSTGLNLGDYGDSDEEQSDEDSSLRDADTSDQKETQEPSSDKVDAEEKSKAARRERAKEWSARRRAEKSLVESEGKDNLEKNPEVN